MENKLWCMRPCSSACLSMCWHVSNMWRRSIKSRAPLLWPMLCVLVLFPTDPAIQLLFSLDPPPAVSPLLPPEHLIPGLTSLDCLQCSVVFWWRGPWPFCIHFSGNFVMLLTEKSLPCRQNFCLDRTCKLGCRVQILNHLNWMVNDTHV